MNKLVIIIIILVLILIGGVIYFAKKKDKDSDEKEKIYDHNKLLLHRFEPDFKWIDSVINQLKLTNFYVQSFEINDDFKIKPYKKKTQMSWDEFMALSTENQYHSIKIVFTPDNDPFGVFKYINKLLNDSFNGTKPANVSLRIQRVPWRYNYHFDAQHVVNLSYYGKRRATLIPYELGNKYNDKKFSDVEQDLEYNRQKRIFDLEPGDVLNIPFGWYHLFESFDTNTDPLISISCSNIFPLTSKQQEIRTHWHDTYPERLDEVKKKDDHWNDK